MESLFIELAPLGIKVTIVEPGPFRTDWAGRSIIESKTIIEDYAETASKRRESTRANSGKQAGDPVRGAEAVIQAVESPEPPLRLLLGAPALDLAYKRLDILRANFDAWKETSLGADYPPAQQKASASRCQSPFLTPKEEKWPTSEPPCPAWAYTLLPFSKRDSQPTIR